MYHGRKQKRLNRHSMPSCRHEFPPDFFRKVVVTAAVQVGYAFLGRVLWSDSSSNQRNISYIVTSLFAKSSAKNDYSSILRDFLN